MSYMIHIYLRVHILLLSDTYIKHTHKEKKEEKEDVGFLKNK